MTILRMKSHLLLGYLGLILLFSLVNGTTLRSMSKPNSPLSSEDSENGSKPEVEGVLFPFKFSIGTVEKTNKNGRSEDLETHFASAGSDLSSATDSSEEKVERKNTPPSPRNSTHVIQNSRQASDSRTEKTESYLERSESSGESTEYSSESSYSSGQFETPETSSPHHTQQNSKTTTKPQEIHHNSSSNSTSNSPSSHYNQAASETEAEATQLSNQEESSTETSQTTPNNETAETSGNSNSANDQNNNPMNNSSDTNSGASDNEKTKSTEKANNTKPEDPPLCNQPEAYICQPEDRGRNDCFKIGYASCVCYKNGKCSNELANRCFSCADPNIVSVAEGESCVADCTPSANGLPPAGGNDSTHTNAS